MRGDERERHCSKCTRTVVNLSRLTEAERTELLEAARREGKGLCVAYYQRLSGEFVSAEKPLKPSEARAIAQFGVTALSAAALALVARQAPEIGQALERAADTAATAYVSARDEALLQTVNLLAAAGELVGGAPFSRPAVVMVAGEMICPPRLPTALPNPTVAPPSAPTAAN